MSKKLLKMITLIVLLGAIGCYVFSCLSTDREKVCSSWVHVKSYSHYELMENGKVLLSFDEDTISGTGCFVNSWMLVPSCKGRILVNIDSTIWHNKYAHINPDTLLKEKTAYLDSMYKDSQWRVHELSYYLHSHSVVDEGYNMISQYAEKEKHQYDYSKKMLDSLHNFSGRKLKIIHRLKFVAFYQTTLKAANGKRITKKASQEMTLLKGKDETATFSKEGNYVFQLTSLQTPEGVRPLAEYQARKLIYADNTPLRKLPPLYYHPDSLSSYQGETDSIHQPHGHGAYLHQDGTYYEGAWVHGKRNGFGFSISGKKPLKVGEWKDDRYKGERIVYTSDRIYGIDISKYQHVIGKKKYSIDWKRLRISHLGNISKKTISGNVNFPIRFIYVKSTEGSTMLNPYYRQDYLSARAHGYKVGSYHFFSTISPAGQQARQFLKHTMMQRGDFPPVLDVEPTKEQIKKMGGIYVLFARVRTWLKMVEKDVGVKPILYINQTFVNRYLNLAPDLKHNYQIWIARYGEYKPDVHLIYWQLCPDGRVSGIHGEVDINVFNGYKDSYEKFIKTETIK